MSRGPAAAPPRIPDPRAVPVTGTDAHLPAILAGALTPESLRLRFARAAHDPPWQPEHLGDGGPAGLRGRSAAAVLVPLVSRPGGLQVLLTRRAAELRDHAGQISFPGGRAEPQDEGAAGTALREAEEEVGLARDRVELLGQLPAYTSVTGFVVTPVVGLVSLPPGPVALAIDRHEVAEAFEVPFSFLMDPAHHRRHVFVHEGGQRQFLSMPWHGTAADGSPREYFIWGATAAMLRNLYRFLAG
ncbi:MAG: CoA pyrophosphatase [Burkholderiales bacterium]|nr:CoA pyrophosphatase [Burkholderiales bacterium]